MELDFSIQLCTTWQHFGQSQATYTMVVGDDSSLCVIVLEDLPVGQDVEVEDSEINDRDPI